MTRENLKLFQDTYAEAMTKYVLKRGVDGSEAKHATNQEYYRELFVQKDELQEYVEVLQEQKTEINEKIRNLYDRKDEAREKFLNMDEYNSPEHNQDFNVQDAKLQLFREQDNPDKFRLSFNGQNILDWFKQKRQEIKQVIRPHIKPPAKPEIGKNKGFKR
jgi:hypothetical protein